MSLRNLALLIDWPTYFDFAVDTPQKADIWLRPYQVENTPIVRSTFSKPLRAIFIIAVGDHV